MSRVIEGYLMLGWEVEMKDAENYDIEDGLTEQAESKVTEILGKDWIHRTWCEPIVFPTLYYPNDYMYVGFVLMSSDCSSFDVADYARHMGDNADLFERTACELYGAIMGSEPSDRPKLMCVACEG